MPLAALESNTDKHSARTGSPPANRIDRLAPTASKNDDALTAAMGVAAGKGVPSSGEKIV